ncbi:DegV family protein [Solimonas soli]|uniref:DegV family protein n=1 Tax=Solimonas soli TaxID=413479 RepID=UPI000485F3ED|nr:DegV family protein [Solimonas soli]
MRVGVVTDATCDLPAEFLRAHDIGVLPVTIQLGDERFDDVRDRRTTRRFYAEQLAARGFEANTQAYGVDQLRALLLRRVVPFYDYVFCVTISATRSSMFENAAKAAFVILADEQSAPSGRGPFVLRVIDSRSMFSGTGVLVAEAAKCARAGMTPFELRRHLDVMRDQLCAYIVPGDLYHLHRRAQKKGEKSVDWFSYALGATLDLRPVILGYQGDTQAVARVRGYDQAVERTFAHVARQIETGDLRTSHVCVSYGGEPAELDVLPGYAPLRETAARHGIELLPSVMSATAAVNVGAGCVAVAYCGGLQPFRD